MNNNSFELIKKFWFHIGKKYQFQYILVIFLSIICAFSEALSLGALIPFLSVLVSPDSVFDNPLIFKLAIFFNLNSPDKIILPITLVFVSAVLLSMLLRIFHYWLTIKISFSCGIHLNSKLYSSILNQSYIEHLNLKSSQIISAIQKVDIVVNALSQVVRLITSIIIVFFITLAIIFINPVVSVITFSLLGGIYYFILIFFKSIVSINSKNISNNRTEIIKSLQDGLGSIRDVILDRTQEYFLNTFKKADGRLKNAELSNSFIEGTPRFLMEALGMVFVSLLAYFLCVHIDGLEKSIPFLGALALAAQRILPSMQQAYNAIVSINGHYSSLSDVLNLLNISNTKQKILSPSQQKLVMNDSIELKNVHFRYNKNSRWIFKGINLKLKKGKKIGIIGTTGSGKTTLFDLLMGLLEPTKGKIYIDGKLLTKKNIASWQENIAHVPQLIFLSDASIAENIAFGTNEFNFKNITDAARDASANNFIEKLPKKYKTFVGERGISLSGGERQRIAIARAFYKQSSILFFDEATSALDSKTESDVMRAIDSLSPNHTLFIIAHRMTTLKKCDVILQCVDGKVIQNL